MRYLSPNSLPGSLPINARDKKALALQRRKLLAELELSADGHLCIGHRTFSKSDILEYFETLQDETVLHYHDEVSKDEILVKFLEEGRLSGNAAFAQTNVYENIDFLKWISPYFCAAFTKYVIECLKEANEDGLQALLQNRLLLTDYDRERAWTQIGQPLEQNISLLDHYNDQLAQNNSVVSINDIAPLVTNSYIRTILQLPKDSFAGVRDRYAIAIMPLSTYFFNKLKANRDTALAWAENARLLAVSKEVIIGVSGTIAEMEKVRNKSSAQLIRVAAIIGIIFFKMLACQNWGGYSAKDTPKFTRFNYIKGKDTITIHNVQQLDSVLHKVQNADSATTSPPPGESH